MQMHTAGAFGFRGLRWSPDDSLLACMVASAEMASEFEASAHQLHLFSVDGLRPVSCVELPAIACWGWMPGSKALYAVTANSYQVRSCWLALALLLLLPIRSTECGVPAYLLCCLLHIQGQQASCCLQCWLLAGQLQLQKFHDVDCLQVLVVSTKGEQQSLAWLPPLWSERDFRPAPNFPPKVLAGPSRCGQRLLVLRMTYQSSTLFAIDIRPGSIQAAEEVPSALVRLAGSLCLLRMPQDFTLRAAPAGAAHDVPELDALRRRHRGQSPGRRRAAQCPGMPYQPAALLAIPATASLTLRAVAAGAAHDVPELDSLFAIDIRATRQADEELPSALVCLVSLLICLP